MFVALYDFSPELLDRPHVGLEMATDCCDPRLMFSLEKKSLNHFYKRLVR